MVVRTTSSSSSSTMESATTSPSATTKSSSGSNSAYRGRIVSPLSGVSVKSQAVVTIPDALYIASSSSSTATAIASASERPILGPEDVVVDNRAVYSDEKAGGTPQGTKTTTKTPKTYHVKARKRARLGHMMEQNYFPFKLHSLLTLTEKFGYQVSDHDCSNNNHDPMGG